MTAENATDPTVADPFGQSRYQVRFDWGFAGAHAVAADADIVIWADAVPPFTTPAEDEPSPATALAAAVSPQAAIVAAGLVDARVVAGWVIGEQERLGRRAMIAVVAAGEPRGGGVRFAVEDLLAAGAVIDALAEVGIDFTSPEAAAACAAFAGLRGAVAHLVTASASGQAALAAGVARADLAALGRPEPSAAVRVLR